MLIMIKFHTLGQLKKNYTTYVCNFISFTFLHKSIEQVSGYNSLWTTHISACLKPKPNSWAMRHIYQFIMILLLLPSGCFTCNYLHITILPSCLPQYSALSFISSSHLSLLLLALHKSLCLS